MAQIEQKVEELLKKYELPKESAWLHAQSKKWIMKHSALEVIGAAIGVQFDMPTIVQLDLLQKVACIVVRGTMPDGLVGQMVSHDGKTKIDMPRDRRVEWSFGEATADNCKMNYYAAMAEKRAKDRVILKFLNLHGEVYSEEEADDFKQKKTTAKAKKSRAIEIEELLNKTNNLDELYELWISLTDELKDIKFENDMAFFTLEKRKDELKESFTRMHGE